LRRAFPLWPRATWVPEKENADGEKARSLKVEISTKPGNLNGKDHIKSFKIYRSGTPEEWILWRQDFNEVCVGMSLRPATPQNTISIIDRGVTKSSIGISLRHLNYTVVVGISL
jgi:hypothetical protein